MKNRDPSALRLAIVVSHPIQYYAPWFAYLTAHLKAQVRVFYLWDFGVSPQIDPGFGCEVLWDIDLLAGYDHSFVTNEAADPGTHHFLGLDNPELTAELAEWKPDAILLFGYRYSSHLRIITSRRLRKVPIIFRGDSHLLAGRGNALQSAGKALLLRLIFRRFAACLSPGRAHTAYLEQNGVARGKIFHAPHAVDNERFFAAQSRAEEEAKASRDELRIPEHHRVILFAGKFERKKCPDALVRAFLAAKISDTTLLLVGAGELETELRRLAEDHANLRMAPFQNQRAMPRTYAAADLVVLPSRGPGESWGLVVNEALCCGKAVIVSDEVGCHADLVRHGHNGLVFRAGDEAALTGALRDALSDSARLEAWGKAGREMIRSFSYEAATTGLENALTSLLAQGRPR